MKYKHENIKELYRVVHWYDNPYLTLQTFPVISYTPEGFWIEDVTKAKWDREQQRFAGPKKWVSKNANKRFAYETIDLALNSYRIRATWRTGHLRRQLEQTELGRRLSIDLAEGYTLDDKYSCSFEQRMLKREN